MNSQSVSIIVTCGEQQQQLRQLLPSLLSLRYGGDYEVIVVDKMHDKDLEEWLEDMEAQYSYLSHTFCPASSRGLDIQRLALTLGAKAANFEWLAILPVDVNLPSEDWLRQLSKCCGDEVDVAIGMTSRKKRFYWFGKLFRRAFSIFNSTSSIILCRSRILFKSDTRIDKKRLLRLPLYP